MAKGGVFGNFTEPTASVTSGVWGMREQEQLIRDNKWPRILTSGLTLYLDADDEKSYPGTGTTWFDLSGNGYDFNLNAGAFTNSGGIKYMNFSGSFGIAKRVVSNALTNVPNFTNGTIMVFSTILNSTTTYRTLTRGSGSTGDHQVLTNTGTNTLGMWNNAGTVGFVSASYDITNIPNVYTKFNCLTFKLSQSSPYYDFSVNAGSSLATITNALATFDTGFCSIGGYHNESVDVNTSNQYWGNIGAFLYYNRALTAAEIQQNYTFFRGRYGI